MSETTVVNNDSNAITINKKNLKYITFMFCYVFIAFYFLINGRALFPNWSANDTSSIFIYLVGVVAFLTVSIPFSSKLNLNEKYQSKTLAIITNFSLAFPIFWMIFILIKDSGFWFQNISPLPVYLIIPTTIFQIFVVAASEEIIFRGTIFPLIAKVNVIIAIFLTSIFFAIFHFGAYGGNIFAIYTTFLIGLILVILYIKFNIGASIAFHAVYNLIVVGALVI
ncbi:MAG: CPBP family intramembrane metalloprotease [Bacteroidetes bacterium]|nr:CPBP family intramembrane metalloprotease [Bacteroidota bacterium]